MQVYRFFVLLIISCSLWADDIERYFDDAESLARDLELVQQIDCEVCDKVPVTYNHTLMGGYLNMPSALMSEVGVARMGYSSVPPYSNYNIAFQAFPRMELSGSYRVLRGVPDPLLSPSGFGDASDRGLSVKFAIMTFEDTEGTWPAVSMGFDDFAGTRGFASKYIVATYASKRWDFEASLGLGGERYKGVFGGINWMPLRKVCSPYFQGLTFTAEYDAIDYKHERHPEGRDYWTRINLGMKYRLWDLFDFSASYIRGKEFAWSAALSYNLGDTCGFFPKCDDLLPYCAPVISEPIGCRRPIDTLTSDLIYPFRRQGFRLLESGLHEDICGETVLRLRVLNECYLTEYRVREQLEHLLAYLTPDNVAWVLVVMESKGFPAQTYRFRGEALRLAREHLVCPYALTVMTPLGEVNYPPRNYIKLFEQPRELFCLYVAPKTQFLFGSARGKFKSAWGLTTGATGFLAHGLQYRLGVGYLFYSNIPTDSEFDWLNPSQLPNVHTDLLKYYRQGLLTLDEAYLQKIWNIGRGVFVKGCVGYFDPQYAGVAGEIVFYPVNSIAAIGAHGAQLFKRRANSLGFSSTVRQMSGLNSMQVPFHGHQYFLDLYYRLLICRMDFKISVGRFLAGDRGARFEAYHSYPSGLRVGAWFTYTDAHDKVNRKTYYDKGIFVSMPLDIFYTCSCRDRWYEAISPWLRDCGYQAPTGDSLYQTIRDERE